MRSVKGLVITMLQGILISLYRFAAAVLVMAFTRKRHTLTSIQLKNADRFVKLDDHVHKWLSEHADHSKDQLLENLRLHSSGCAVFQKTSKVNKGEYKTKTLYLHKIIAESFLANMKTDKKTLVGTKNGDKLDCRLENLVYRSRSDASRMRKTTSQTGYTGVYKENHRYRAVISVHGKSVHLGMFDTPEAAAAAYNQKSWDVYGEKGKFNVLDSSIWEKPNLEKKE